MNEGDKAKQDEKHRVAFEFREKLNAVSEGFRHNLCYQCGACVGDCPAANYSDTFNPRLILLKALLGFEDELISLDSDIWNCTNCYTCAERCPQDVRPVDVIIALKNLCTREGKAPDLVRIVSDAVFASGITTKLTALIERRRREFGLPAIGSRPVEDLKKLADGD